MQSTLSLNCFRFGAAILLACFAGCGGKEMAQSQPSGGGGIQFWTSSDREAPVPGFDIGSIMFGSYKSGTLLIWSDTDSLSGGFPVSFPIAKADGTLEYPSSKNRIKYSCEYDVNSGVGHCTINEKTYDLEQGALFLVSITAPEVRVKQLNRDLNNLRPALGPRFDREKLISFGQSDVEITEFFSKTK